MNLLPEQFKGDTTPQNKRLLITYYKICRGCVTVTEGGFAKTLKLTSEKTGSAPNIHLFISVINPQFFKCGHSKISFLISLRSILL